MVWQKHSEGVLNVIISAVMAQLLLLLLFLI